jgi:enoyl-CoA hydratase
MAGHQDEAGDRDEVGAATEDVVVSWPEEGIALVELNRPAALNALTREMTGQIGDTFRALGDDPACRVIVLTGRGRGFCAGQDMKAAASRRPDEPVVVKLRSQERFAGMVRTMRAIRQPVIAAVNGPAAGAGMALTLGADVRVAAPAARFLVAAVKIGLSGGESGISWHLPRLIGASRAAEVLLTGRPVDALEAERIGLVSRVVEADQLIEEAMDVARQIRANAPLSIELTKHLMWANLSNDFDEAIDLENRTQLVAGASADAAEAKRAFVERRTPVWGV